MQSLHHLKIVCHTAQVIEDIVIFEILDNSRYAIVSVTILSHFNRWWSASHKAFVESVSSLLDFSKTINQGPDSWVIDTKLTLNSMVCSFSIVVGSLQMLLHSFMHAPHLQTYIISSSCTSILHFGTL